MPENSIRYDNRFFIQPCAGKLTACVEISLTNVMKDMAFISRMQVIDSKDAKMSAILGVDSESQAISRRSTYKFMIRYDLAKDVDSVKDFGRIQFSWKTDSPDVEGGILAYNVVCNLERRQDDIHLERGDDIILKKFEITPITLTLINP